MKTLCCTRKRRYNDATTVAKGRHYEKTTRWIVFSGRSMDFFAVKRTIRRLSLQMGRTALGNQKALIYSRFEIRDVMCSRAIGFIDNLEVELLRLAEITGNVGLSPRKIERLFHSYLKCSPKQFDLKCCVLRGKARFQQTTLPIWAVSLICGFVNTVYFSSVHRCYFGFTPTNARALKSRSTLDALIERAIYPHLFGYQYQHVELV